MWPSYLNLSARELEEREEQLFEFLRHCKVCPRQCGVNRLENQFGYCKVGFYPRVSAYHPHFGEERVLVGENGSGTIFFTSCNLSCVYCQNYEISQIRIGEEVSFEQLSSMMINLQKMGCHNINFVTPTHQIPQIVRALRIAIEKGLRVPLVYNTSAYDTVEILKILDGIFDIYMPDLKYGDNEPAQQYSFAPNYFQIAKEAIKEMHRQVGDLLVDENGIAKRGLLVRHLVLPNDIAKSQRVFEFIAKEVSKDTFLNVMNQYFPFFKATSIPPLSRPITRKEYEEALRMAKECGLNRIYHE